MNKRPLKVALLLALNAMVSSTASADVFPAVYSSEPITKFGYVEYGQSAHNLEIDSEFVTAGFYEYSRDITGELSRRYPLKDGFVTIEKDTCFPNKSSSVQNLWQGRWPLRAGAELNFSDDTGVLHSIAIRIVSQTELTYMPERRLPFVPSGDLIVDIPGESFPQFAKQTMPELPRIKNLRADSEHRTFSWMPMSDGAYLSLTFFISSDGKTKDLYAVDCDIVDDGAFSLDETEYATGFSKLVLVRAMMTKLIRKDESLLLLQRSQEFRKHDLR